MNIVNHNAHQTIGGGLRDLGVNCGQPSRAIVVHWSCSTTTRLKSSIAHTLAVAVGASSEVALHSLVAVGSPHFQNLSSPHWDRDRRELWLDGVLVKRFRQPSPNQEKILATFQEEDWPSFIDDPLPQDVNHEPKRRLNHTIRNLNRSHRNDNLIHFEGDGTGERVTWKRLPGSDWRHRRQLPGC